MFAAYLGDLYVEDVRRGGRILSLQVLSVKSEVLYSCKLVIITATTFGGATYFLPKVLK